jgi:hypothetical protein
MASADRRSLPRSSAVGGDDQRQDREADRSAKREGERSDEAEAGGDSPIG